MMVMLRALQKSRAVSSHGGFLEWEKTDIEEVYEVRDCKAEGPMIAVSKLASGLPVKDLDKISARSQWSGSATYRPIGITSE